MMKKEKMLQRFGFTLVELMIAMFVSILLLGTVGYIFSKFYFTLHKSFELNRKDSSLIYVSEIINFDLMKAGYHYDGSLSPVDWDSSSKKLVVRYVDYDVSGCEDKFWSDGDSSCNYEITYYLSDGKLYRKVDVGADGDGQVSSMFLDDISVNGFEAVVNQPMVQYKISCEFKGLKNDKNFEISNVVVCHNWN